MEMTIDENTRLIDLNLGQISEYFRSVIREEVGGENEQDADAGEFNLKGIREIAKYVEMAPSTLNEWKSKGYLDYAIRRVGNRTYWGSSKRLNELRDLGLLGNPIMKNRKTIPLKYQA